MPSPDVLGRSDLQIGSEAMKTSVHKALVDMHPRLPGREHASR